MYLEIIIAIILILLMVALLNIKNCSINKIIFKIENNLLYL